MNPGASPFPKRAHTHSCYRVLCLFLRRKRQEPLSPRLFGWLNSVVNADLDKIKDINGLDCYVFVRFLRMMVRVLLPIWIISWAVLIPLSSVDTGDTKGSPNVPGFTSLDILTIYNIVAALKNRYWGHLILIWIFTSKIPCWSPSDDS